jgi:hypothetical protein
MAQGVLCLTLIRTRYTVRVPASVSQALILYRRLCSMYRWSSLS